MSDLVRLTLNEWTELLPEPGGQLDGVFLGSDASVHEAAQRLNATGMLQVEELRGGLRVRATSFVGRIVLGPLEITVQPKLEGLPLLQLLRYAYGLRDLKLWDSAEFSTQAHAFQDILVAQLVAEARELLSRGLRRQYVGLREDLASPRGRLDIQAIARRSSRPGGSLPCRHFPRLVDWLPNQLLLSGLKLGGRLACDPKLKSSARRLASVLAEDVTVIAVSSKVFDAWKRQRNRLVAAYDSAILLIQLLVQSAALSLDDNSRSVPLAGFLFDMNRFFETLLSRFLRENLQGYAVRDQHRLNDMLAFVPSQNPKGQTAPTPRPDFAVLDHVGVVMLLDAKYRDLWNRPLPRDMLYQLAIYALSPHARNEAAILYPTLDPDAKESRIEIRDPFRGEGRAYVVQRPVDLYQLADLTASSDARVRRDCAAYAAYLAFGDAAGATTSNATPRIRRPSARSQVSIV